MAETIINQNQFANRLGNIYSLNCEVYGSPYINPSNGEASNLSDSNYFTCGNFFNNVSDSFEFVTAIKMSSAAFAGMGILDDPYAQKIRLTASGSNTLRLRIDANGNNIDITGTTPLTIGTKIYIKVSYNSSTGYALYTSLDGYSWNTEATSNITYKINTGAIFMYMARNYVRGYALAGSIYLADTYINVNGNRVFTAYIVGTGPNDAKGGVYTGFNSNSYLQFKNTYPTPTSSFEFMTRVHTFTLNFGIQMLLTNSNNSYEKGGMISYILQSADSLYLNVAKNDLSGWAINGHLDSAIDLTVGVWAYLKYYIYKSGSSWGINTYWGRNKYDLQNKLSGGAFYPIVSPDVVKLGCHQDWPFVGMIDMNSTYIKVDEEIVLNGADRSSYDVIGDLIEL